MQIWYAVLIVAAALVVGAAVTFFTKKMLETQKKIAVEVNRLAGVRGIFSETKATGFRSILATSPPRTRLDVLAVSGWTVLQPQVMTPLLEAGVEVRALLLDPKVEVDLLADAPWMRQQTIDTIHRLANLRRPSASFRVRLYQAPQLQTLLFLDDDRLYVSSFPPVTSRSSLVFEIGPGEKSLYQLYRDAFEFLWERSEDLR